MANGDREAVEIRELDYQAQPADIERCRDELRLYAYQLTGSLRHADNLADDALLLDQRQGEAKGGLLRCTTGFTRA